MKSSERSNMPTSPAEPHGAFFTAAPDAYAAYAQMLELINGLPLDKQQAICRYLADHVAQKARALNQKKVKTDGHER